MTKLVGRYVIAAFMIPVGLALGVCGFMQNALRRRRYLEKEKRILQQLDES